jgi:hypothetical protein
MGLFTDHLHEKIKKMTDIMVGVAQGRVHPDTLGRWIATFHPDRAKELPQQQQVPLSPADGEALALTHKAFDWNSNPVFPSGSSHDIDRRVRDSIGPGFRDPLTGQIR